jgi:hypothetical protein
MIKIHKNFLSDDEFKKLYDFFVKKSDFPWYKSPVLNELDYIQFTHRFYDDFQPLSSFMHVLNPLLNKINPKAIIRIKANLLTRTEKKIAHGLHTDVDADCTTAVYYVNSNNGETVFENKKSITSEENKFVSFSSRLKHSGTTNTCLNKCRIVINLNYF